MEKKSRKKPRGRWIDVNNDMRKADVRILRIEAKDRNGCVRIL
jgi:hypothetical protein